MKRNIPFELIENLMKTEETKQLELSNEETATAEQRLIPETRNKSKTIGQCASQSEIQVKN